jgi:hypothetical protein
MSKYLIYIDKCNSMIENKAEDVKKVKNIKEIEDDEELEEELKEVEVESTKAGD